MLTFRKAVPADLTGIMSIVHEAQAFMATLNIDQWQDGYPSEELIAEDICIGRAYVFDDGGEIASVSILTAEHEPIYDQIDTWNTPDNCLVMHRVAIGDRWRHSGLAARILENAVRIAHEESLSGIRADTHRGNVAMRRFLEKNGFRSCGLVTYETHAGDPIRVAYDLNL